MLKFLLFVVLLVKKFQQKEKGSMGIFSSKGRKKVVKYEIHVLE
jgi:hypothetical protein